MFANLGETRFASCETCAFPLDGNPPKKKKKNEKKNISPTREKPVSPHKKPAVFPFEKNPKKKKKKKKNPKKKIFPPPSPCRRLPCQYDGGPRTRPAVFDDLLRALRMF